MTGFMQGLSLTLEAATTLNTNVWPLKSKRLSIPSIVKAPRMFSTNLWNSTTQEHIPPPQSTPTRWTTVLSPCEFEVSQCQGTFGSLDEQLKSKWGSHLVHQQRGHSEDTSDPLHVQQRGLVQKSALLQGCTQQRVIPQQLTLPRKSMSD